MTVKDEPAVRPMVIGQTQLTDDIGERIARLKMLFWPYGLESQLRWLRDETEPDDRHVLLLNGPDLVGYLRLTRRAIVGCGQAPTILGVATVAVTAQLQGRGLGLALMSAANDVIRAESGTMGALCCTSDKVGFYERCGWTLSDRAFRRADDSERRFFHDENVLTLGATEGLGPVVLVAGKPF